MIELDIRLPEQFLNEEIRYGYTITRQNERSMGC